MTTLKAAPEKGHEENTDASEEPLRRPDHSTADIPTDDTSSATAAEEMATEATNPDDGTDREELNTGAGEPQDAADDTRNESTSLTRQGKEPSESLTLEEQSDLKRYRDVIDKGLQTFSEVGNALRAIKDGRLYRATHKTFEAFCREEFGMSRAHACRQIDASVVVTRLTESTKSAPIGDAADNPATPVFPANEGQVRPLVSLPEDKQVEAWVETVEAAEKRDVSITARLVKEVTAKYREDDPDAKPSVRQPRLGRTEIEPLVDKMDDLVKAKDIEGLEKALSDFRAEFLDAA